jgi:hypothetical protein
MYFQDGDSLKKFNLQEENGDFTGLFSTAQLSKCASIIHGALDYHLLIQKYYIAISRLVIHKAPVLAVDWS